MGLAWAPLGLELSLGLELQPLGLSNPRLAGYGMYLIVPLCRIFSLMAPSLLSVRGSSSHHSVALSSPWVPFHRCPFPPLHSLSFVHGETLPSEFESSSLVGQKE